MNTYDENRKIYFENLAVQVRELVVSEKLYTQHHLSLDDVADRLEVSRYYVSHAVNNYLGKSFITLVDELLSYGTRTSTLSSSSSISSDGRATSMP